MKQFFYGPDALPVTQSMTTKHWRKLVVWPRLFFILFSPTIRILWNKALVPFKLVLRHQYTNLDGRLEAVHVMSTVASVAQQHVLSVSFTSTDATVSVQRRSRPRDARLQHRAVNPQLRQARRQHQRLLPTFQRSPLFLCTRLDVNARHATFCSLTLYLITWRLHQHDI